MAVSRRILCCIWMMLLLSSLFDRLFSAFIDFLALLDLFHYFFRINICVLLHFLHFFEDYYFPFWFHFIQIPLCLQISLRIPFLRSNVLFNLLQIFHHHSMVLQMQVFWFKSIDLLISLVVDFNLLNVVLRRNFDWHFLYPLKRILLMILINLLMLFFKRLYTSEVVLLEAMWRMRRVYLFLRSILRLIIIPVILKTIRHIYIRNCDLSTQG